MSQYVVAVVCSPAPFFCMMMQVTAAHTHGSGMQSNMQGCYTAAAATTRGDVPMYLKDLLRSCRPLRHVSMTLFVQSLTFLALYMFSLSVAARACRGRGEG